MAKNNNLGDFLKGIADKIRTKLSSSDPINPQDFEDKIDAVYDSGKNAQYDEFWDAYQENGNRTNYRFAFAGCGWTADNFKPKYDIAITAINNNIELRTFDSVLISGSIKQTLESQGVELKFQNLGSTNTLFRFIYNCPNITELPILDFSSITGGDMGISMVCWLEELHTIEKLIFPTTKVYSTGTGEGLLGYCPKLKNIVFEGVCCASLWLARSKELTADSVDSILGHLDSGEYTGTRTLTLPNEAVHTYEAKYGSEYPDSVAARIALLNSEGANWTLALI